MGGCEGEWVGVRVCVGVRVSGYEGEWVGVRVNGWV